MFASAYCTMQIGRSLYMVWASWGVHPARARSFLRIVFWLCLSLPQDGLRWLAFATCFLGSAALWWLYFDTGARRGSQVIEASDQAGLLARNAYTYWHIPINRKSVVEGKSVSVRVDLGGRRIFKKKKTKKN